MEDHFDKKREEMSNDQTIISRNCLQKILDGITKIEEKKDNFKIWLIENQEQYSDDMQNIALANATVIGKQISRCADETDRAVQEITHQFFDALDGPQAISIDLLNIVHRILVNLNAIDNPNAITTEVDRRLATIKLEFMTKSVSTIDRYLNNVHQSTILLPQKTETCINGVLSQIDGNIRLAKSTQLNI